MAYTRYNELIDDRVNCQYNIMALVGNGFDIQVLSNYDKAPTTRYEDFYHFLQMKRTASINPIIQEMEIRRNTEGLDSNWSDVEDCVSELLKKSGPTGIAKALSEMQTEFSEFLNLVSDSSLLSQLNEDAKRFKWSHTCLSKFLHDIKTEPDLKKIEFGSRTANYDLYNFYFINFNFTSLLDNYLYLDQDQFDPRPHFTAKTNFYFDTNPRRINPERNWNYESSSYLTTEIVHPHGYQDIPRSLLFGTGDISNSSKSRARLSKPYWAQNDLKYRHLFEDTTVFVIFGCSLGATDKWWWNMIAESLLNDKKRALIIYRWISELDSPETDSELKKFLDAANVDEDSRAAVAQQICVITHRGATDHVWLGMSKDELPASQ